MAMSSLRQTTTFLLSSSFSSVTSPSLKGSNLSNVLRMKRTSRQKIIPKAWQRSVEKQSLRFPSYSMSRSASPLALSMKGTYLIKNSQSRYIRSLWVSDFTTFLRRVLRDWKESSVEADSFSCGISPLRVRSNRQRQLSRMRRSFWAILEWLLPVVPASWKRKISSKQEVRIALCWGTPMSPTSTSMRLQLKSSKGGMYSTECRSVSKQRETRAAFSSLSSPSLCRHWQRYLSMLLMSCSTDSLNCCDSLEETSPSPTSNPSLSSSLSRVRLLRTFRGPALRPLSSRLLTKSLKREFHSKRKTLTRAWLSCRTRLWSFSSRQRSISLTRKSLREARVSSSKAIHSPRILRVRTVCAKRRVWGLRVLATREAKDSKKLRRGARARRVKISLRELASSLVWGAEQARSMRSTSLAQSAPPSPVLPSRHCTSSSKGRSISMLQLLCFANAKFNTLALLIDLMNHSSHLLGRSAFQFGIYVYKI